MTAPAEDYDSLDVPQVRRRLKAMTPDQLRRTESYELAHRRRKTLLTTLARMLRDPVSRKPETTILSQDWEVE